MSVIIESAGDHSFDLPHLRRSGGEELIQLLLEKAGFKILADWRVRVNEKQRCSGMTPPVSVIRYKEWGVYVRIKPGDNNTCHNVTLLIPTGHSAGEVFGKLKAVEKSFNRNWRKADSVVTDDVSNSLKVTEVVQVADSVMSQVIEELEDDQDVGEEVVLPATRFNVTAFLANADNLKAICLTVHALGGSRYRNHAQFMASLCESLGVKMDGRQSGAMMRSVANRDLVRKSYDGGRHIGYSLTKKGMALIKDDLAAPSPDDDAQEIKPSTKPLNRAKLLRDLGPLATDISHAAARLQAISVEREELLKKLGLLDKEEQELCDLLDNDQISGFLNRLSSVNKQG